MPDAPQGQSIEPRLLGARSTLSARLDRMRPVMSVAEFNAAIERQRMILWQQITDAINTATRQGVSPADAVNITVGVAADLARGVHGTAYLQTVAQAVIARAGKPFDQPKPSDEPR